MEVVKLPIYIFIMTDQQVPLVVNTGKPAKKSSAEKEAKKQAMKGGQSKKKEGAALISIDVTKEENFSEWVRFSMIKFKLNTF